MDAFLTWLKYGLFGRPVMKIASASEMTPTRLIVLILLLVFLVVFIIVTKNKLWHGLVLGIIFVLLFGYLAGIALAIVAVIVKILTVGPPPSLPENDNGDERVTQNDIDYALSDMDSKAQRALEPFGDYGAYKAQRASITTRKALDDFISRWKDMIDRNA